jgi:microcystin-dependent protein
MSPVPTDPFTAVTGADILASELNARFDELYRTLDGGDIGLDIDNLSAALIQLVLRPGMISMTAAATADAGWLLCDGSAVSRTTYAALFARIGTTHGAGNGTTTFNLPDFQGRTAVGSGTGSGLSAKTLGAKVGTEPSNMPSHFHGAGNGQTFMTSTRTVGLAGDGGAQPYWVPDGNSDTTDSKGSGSATDGNVPPSTVVNYQIKT